MFARSTYEISDLKFASEGIKYSSCPSYIYLRDLGAIHRRLIVCGRACSEMWFTWPFSRSTNDIVLFPDHPTKNGGRVWEMGLYVCVAEEFVARNYMQPQSEHVETTWTHWQCRVLAPYVATAATASATAGNTADCLAQRDKPSYR